MEQTPEYQQKHITGRLKQKELNQLSAEGWELVSAQRQTLPLISPATSYIFKRPKQDDGTPAITVDDREAKRIKSSMKAAMILVLAPIALIVLVVIIAVASSSSDTPAVPSIPITTPSDSSETASTAVPTPASATPAVKPETSQQIADNAAWLASPAGQLCSQHPTWEHKVCTAIISKTPLLGMTEDQARLAWGTPDHIVTSDSDYIGESDDWFYTQPGEYKSLYFNKGILKQIQQ